MSVTIPQTKHIHGTVTARRDLSDSLWLIRVKPEEPIPFTPGQYTTLALEGPEKLIERAYSMCSSPHEDELEFFLELVPQGQLSPGLHRLQIGDTMFVRPRAKGIFLRDSTVGLKHELMICTVTGIAPFLSYLRHLAREWKESGSTPSAEVTVLQGASHVAEFGYLEELTKLDKELPWFHFVPTISRPWDEPEWTGEVGRVDELARKYLDNAGAEPGSTRIYLCGNPMMIENLRNICARRGFAKDEIREEQYWTD